MAGHEQFGEDLALYALNALEGEDRRKIEEHLASCTECRLELEQLRGDGALLALSTTGPRPPLRAKKRLLDAIAAESPASRPQTAREQKPPRHSWWGWLGWAATGAVIVLAAALWKENRGLREEAGILRRVTSQQASQLDELRRIAAPIIEPEAQRVILVAMKTPPQPQGKAFYLRNRSSLVFVANNMPALPAQKAYELWLIPTQGAPILGRRLRPGIRLTSQD